MLRPSSGSASRRTSRALDEPVDAVGHGAARDERLLQQLLRAQLERLAGAAQRREHVALPRLEVAAAERVATGAVEVPREPVDARQHLEGREVEVGALRDPRLDDAVDFVRLLGHASIIGAGSAVRRRSRHCASAHDAASGRLDGRRPSLGRRGPPWCNGSTTAFGAVRSRFESWRRSMTESIRAQTPRLAVIVLAAGQGTRMKSALPEGAAPHRRHAARRPRARHRARARRRARRRRRAPRARPGRRGRRSTSRPSAIVVDQDEIPGTGRAVELGARRAAGRLRRRRARAQRRRAAARRRDPRRPRRGAPRRRGRGDRAHAPIVDDATGYGRIVRDADGAVDRIVEQKDATADEHRDRRDQRGHLRLPASPRCATHLAARRHRQRAGREVPHRCRRRCCATRGCRGRGVRRRRMPWLVAGVNDRVQLAEAARLLNALHRARLAARGRRPIHDPATTWIDVTATLAPDVTVLPEHPHPAARPSIAAAPRSDRTRRLVDCEVGEDATVTRTDATLAVIGAGATVGPFAYLRPGTVARRGRQDRHLRRDEELDDRRAAARCRTCRYIGDTTIGDGRQPRRRHDHRQLRRRQQAPHRDRRRRAHRLAQRVRRAR